MKILHIISKFSGGGLERRAIQAVKGLSEIEDVEQIIVVLSKEVEYKEVLQLPVSIHYLDGLSRIERLRKLNSYIFACHPDIVHSWLDHYPSDQILLSILKYMYGYKYIHGAVCDGNIVNKNSSVWVGQKLSFLCADSVVSNSKAGLIAKEAPLNKSTVIYNGFDFSRIPQILDTVKRDEIAASSKYMVTMCGRVDGSKDWKAFMEVARLSEIAGLDAMFVAVGTGDLISDYVKEMKAKGVNNLVFTGRRSDIEELIGLSDVCMLLSNTKRHIEGVSNFIMESMASGKPVIATYGGGTPEILSDGICGYVVKDNINEAFVRLKTLLEDETKRKKFGDKAKEEILSRFTLSQMTQRYYNLYKCLINSK